MQVNRRAPETLMIRVHRALGRAIVVQVGPAPDSSDVLRFQQELSLVIRRLGDPALILTDLRDVQGLDASTSRMLQAMLASPALVSRHALIVTPDTAGADLAALVVLSRGPGWSMCTSVDEVVSALRGAATPAELHAARSLFQEQAAA